YGFAKFGFRISKYLHTFFVMGLLVTAHSVLVPLFILETRLGIDDTRLGVLIPYVGFGLPFMVYLATSFIRGIPDSLEEVARIDGAGYLSIFWHVIRPICAPVVATMTIFSFVANWNEFVFVFVLTSSQRLRSLPVGVNAFAGGQSRDFGLLFAALVIATVPMILFYIFFHEQLKKGFAAGAIKE
ncbi:MAG: carbohydrate ABC transporter permease, partial [Spirochaetales bacterium]|nr:carbohydrate ABC transporter permease [Spirochaetales bacterium]